MMTETEIQALHDENAALRAEVAVLRTTVEQAQAALATAQQMIAQLQEQVADLERRAKTPSFVKRNSPTKETTTEPRQKRQAQHNAARRREEPTRIIRHVLERCPACHYRLRGGHEVWRRQIIEIPLPPPVEIIEHRVITRHCPACDRWQTPSVDFTGAVLGQSRLGVRLVSLLVYLRTVGRLPIRTIQQMLATLHGLRLSVGAIVATLHAARRALASVVEALTAQARASPLLLMVETGWREAGQNGYVWSMSTPGGGPQAVRVYQYDHSRAGVVARTLLGHFAGYLVTDFYCAYNNFSGKQQRCWVHLLRDLHALRVSHAENAEVRCWVRRVMALFRLARYAVRRGERLRPEDRAALAGRLDAAAQRLGLRYAQTKKHPCQTLAKRLLRHQGELFPFVRVAGLSSDNNQAERSIRPLVIARKISGGTRSLEGSQTRLALASLCQTWLARGLNPFVECLALLSRSTPFPQL